MRPVTTRQLARLLPYAIVLGGFALRLYRLGANSLWYDETVSLLLARSELAELTRHTAGDIHPPLYYYLLHFWGQVAGWSEFAAAFFSLFFGVLLVAVVYRVVRALPAPFLKGVGLEVGVIAAFLVALSPYNVWYSQEVRMYTLGATLGVASTYFLCRMLRRGKIFSRELLAYVVFTTLGIYTLYYFIFLIAFQYLWVTFYFLRIAHHSALITFVISQLAVAFLYLPWLPIAFRQATDPPVPPWRSFVALPNVLLESFSALVLGQAVAPATAAPLLVAVLALIAFLFTQSQVAGITSHASRFTPHVTFLFAYTFLPLLLIYLLSLWKPLYHVRYIFTYSPAFYILLALAIHTCAGRLAQYRRYLRPAFIGGALLVLTLAAGYALANFWHDPRYAEDDLRGAVQYIAEHWRPGDALLVNAGYAYPALAYYYPAPDPARMRLVDYRPAANLNDAPIVLMTGSVGGNPRLGWNDPRSDFYPTTADETRAALDRVFRAHPRVWLLRIYDTVTDPDGAVRRYFAEHARLIDDQPFNGEANARVQGYLTQNVTALPATATRVNARLNERVELLGFASALAPRGAGESYDVALYWQPLQTLNYNYQLSLQLLDGAGNVVAQHDEMPLGNALPTSRWRVGEIYREPVRVAIPPTLAPGEYRALVKLYDLNSGEVLGEPIQLGTVRVEP